MPVIRNVTAAGLASVSVFLLVATPISIKMLTTNYSNIYSGYRWTTGIYAFLVDISQQLGPFIFWLFGTSLTAGIVRAMILDVN